MCRFLAYAGAPVLLADMLYRPTNSLIMQSYKARERPEPLNGDGFGVGWYTPEITDDPTACVQRSVSPAWSNKNLQNLSFKLRASLMFAHVRAASPGLGVMEANVHPFNYDRLMWMHNGQISGFHLIKRRLHESLRDEFYNMITGTTDSEYAFALFLNLLSVPFSEATASDLRRALVETINRLDELTGEANVVESSYYNFAVTDGKSIVVSRYASAQGVKGASLHYARGNKFSCGADGACDMDSVGVEAPAQAVIVASERLTEAADDWFAVPDNHTIIVNEDLTVKVESIGI